MRKKMDLYSSLFMIIVELQNIFAQKSLKELNLPFRVIKNHAISSLSFSVLSKQLQDFKYTLYIGSQKKSVGKDGKRLLSEISNMRDGSLR